jgi:Trm5-related predicted tRNA methylase
MDENDEDRVARAILAAPGWARVGISAPKESTREAAAQELALAITKMFGERPSAIDPNQLVLAL